MNLGTKIAVGIAGVAAVGGIVVGSFALNVALSAPVGHGRAIIQKNTAENWTASQARFEDLFAGIQAADRKIAVAQATVDATPTDRTALQTLQGLKSGCLDLVGDYNADARKFLSEEFRAADLPAQISTIDPTTDCK